MPSASLFASDYFGPSEDDLLSGLSFSLSVPKNVLSENDALQKWDYLEQRTLSFYSDDPFLNSEAFASDFGSRLLFMTLPEAELLLSFGVSPDDLERADMRGVFSLFANSAGHHDYRRIASDFLSRYGSSLH